MTFGPRLLDWVLFISLRFFFWGRICSRISLVDYLLVDHLLRRLHSTYPPTGCTRLGRSRHLHPQSPPTAFKLWVLWVDWVPDSFFLLAGLCLILKILKIASQYFFLLTLILINQKFLANIVFFFSFLFFCWHVYCILCQHLFLFFYFIHFLVSFLTIINIM